MTWIKAKVLQFGIKETQYRDRDRFYFQAPGGQVYRLISTAEDMSKWQRQAEVDCFPNRRLPERWLLVQPALRNVRFLRGLGQQIIKS